jgi:REP-associated tyrosine transposase
MPEHFHLLMGEPERADPSVVMQVVKQRFAQNLIERWRSDHMGERRPWHDAREESHVWQRGFYDFVVWTEHKRAEKLDYMHRNPVKIGSVKEPGAWRWSSFQHYECAEPAPVLVNEQIPVELRIT